MLSEKKNRVEKMVLKHFVRYVTVDMHYQKCIGRKGSFGDVTVIFRLCLFSCELWSFYFLIVNYDD